MNRPFSLSLALSAFPGLCHSVGSYEYVTDVLSVMLQIFGQCPNMSKSSQSVRSALKNLHSSDLTIYAGDGMPDTAALAPSSLNPRAAFPTSSWTRFALEFGMMVV